MEQDPSHSEPVRPIGLLVLIVYLTIDGIERGIEAAYGLSLSDKELSERFQVFDTPALVSIFWIGADWLLAALLYLRSWAGRIWTQCLFGIHLFYLFHMIAVKTPEGWLYLSTFSRTQIALSVLIDVAAIAYLTRAAPKDYLTL